MDTYLCPKHSTLTRITETHEDDIRIIYTLECGYSVVIIKEKK